MKYINRTLVVKSIAYKLNTRTPEEWQRKPIHHIIHKVFSDTGSLGQRHHPQPGDIKPNSLCSFINRAKDLGSNGILFDICTYRSGHIPESMTPDLNQNEAVIKPVKITDEEGKSGELVHTYRCIALGDVIIVESVQGSGGTAVLATLLTKLFRRHLDPRHPAVEFNDLGSDDLRQLIASQGGVAKITAKVSIDSGTDGSIYGSMLSNIRTKMPGARKCLVSWDGDDDILSTDLSIDVLEETENESLDSVNITFKNGGSVSSLSKYRERRNVRIQLVDDGRPAVTEIETALKTYLDDLRSPRRASPVNTDGTLKPTKLLGN